MWRNMKWRGEKNIGARLVISTVETPEKRIRGIAA